MGIHTLYYEREHSSDDAHILFSTYELLALGLREQKTTGTFTCHEAVIAIAKLGGYLARRSDGPPGIKALWTGFRALQYLVEGMLLGSQMVARGLS